MKTYQETKSNTSYTKSPAPQSAPDHNSDQLVATLPDKTGCTCDGFCPKCTAQNMDFEKKADLNAEKASSINQPIPIPNHIRIHNNKSAASQAEALHARAFTYGNDIYFNKNEYNPHSADGRGLLAHELTHVKQQTHQPMLQCAPKKAATTTQRQDVALIIGSAANPFEPHAKSQEKVWKAAAHAIAPYVYKAPTLIQACRQLKRHPYPIGTLHIISHSDVHGLATLNTAGRQIPKQYYTTLNKAKQSLGSLGNRAPLTVNFLSCEIGLNTIVLSDMAWLFGAKTASGPMRKCGIQGRQLKSSNKLITKAMAQKIPLSELVADIEQQGWVRYYNFIPGVPRGSLTLHQKAINIAKLYRRIGWVIFISYRAVKEDKGRTRSLTNIKTERQSSRHRKTSAIHAPNIVVEVSAKTRLEMLQDIFKKITSSGKGDVSFEIEIDPRDLQALLNTPVDILSTIEALPSSNSTTTKIK